MQYSNSLHGIVITIFYPSDWRSQSDSWASYTAIISPIAGKHSSSRCVFLYFILWLLLGHTVICNYVLLLGSLLRGVVRTPRAVGGAEPRWSQVGGLGAAAGRNHPSRGPPGSLLKLPWFCRKDSAGAFPRKSVSWASPCLHTAVQGAPRERRFSLVEVSKQILGWFAEKMTCARTSWVYGLETETDFEQFYSTWVIREYNSLIIRLTEDPLLCVFKKMQSNLSFLGVVSSCWVCLFLIQQPYSTVCLCGYLSQPFRKQHQGEPEEYSY